MMGQMLMYVIVITLAALGLVNLLYRISLAVMLPKKYENHALVVKLEDENCEFQLRSAIKKRDHFGPKAFMKIIAVNCGISDEMKHVCRVISYENPDIILCDASDVYRVIAENL
jgi:hypothetical protein